jgi:hypothetical protein
MTNKDFPCMKIVFLAIPSQTNKSFSNAVVQIREQIINDIGKSKL